MGATEVCSARQIGGTPSSCCERERSGHGEYSRWSLRAQRCLAGGVRLYRDQLESEFTGVGESRDLAISNVLVLRAPGWPFSG